MQRSVFKAIMKQTIHQYLKQTKASLLPSFSKSFGFVSQKLLKFKKSCKN
jgi:hypothetical protein